MLASKIRELLEENPLYLVARTPDGAVTDALPSIRAAKTLYFLPADTFPGQDLPEAQADEILQSLADPTKAKPGKTAFGAQVYTKFFGKIKPTDFLSSLEADFKSGHLDELRQGSLMLYAKTADDSHYPTFANTEIFDVLRKHIADRTLTALQINYNLSPRDHEEGRKGFIFTAERGKPAYLIWNDYATMRRVGGHLFPFPESKEMS